MSSLPIIFTPSAASWPMPSRCSSGSAERTTGSLVKRSNTRSCVARGRKNSTMRHTKRSGPSRLAEFGPWRRWIAAATLRSMIWPSAATGNTTTSTGATHTISTAIDTAKPDGSGDPDNHAANASTA
jgi:hypothetical protein